MTDAQVHWHEGLFLQPHHLQWMQKCILDTFARERRWVWTFPYGVLDLHLCDDELRSQRIRFDRLHAIMPSGLEVQVPDSADLPSLDIKEALASSGGTLTISLAVPLRHASRPNAIESEQDEDRHAKVLYRVAEVESPDENTGENPRPLRVRRINARLLLDHDDRSDLEVLPVLRVVQAAGEDVGLPRSDATYIPPCLVVSASPVLRSLLRDLASQVMASRNELARKATEGGFSLDHLRGVQFEQLLRLRTLNRFGALLECLNQASSGVAPFDLYMLLRQLLAELAALRPDREQFPVSEFQHENPFPVFHELSRKIQDLLKGVLPSTYLEAAFTPDETGSWLSATLSEEHLTQPNEYYLAIKTKIDPKELVSLVEDSNKFKLMPLSFIEEAIYGLKLTHEALPPEELPREIGLHYFRVDRAESALMWERVAEERSVAARWPHMEVADFTLTLYMTVP